MKEITMSRPRTNYRRHAVSRAACEPLENRRMLFAVDGTSGPDSISLGISGNDIIFVVNGVSDSRSDLLHSQVEINGLGGADTITIVQTGNNQVTVNGGDGNDTINIALGTHDLDSIEDNVTVNGDANTDRTNVFDDSETGNVNYNFNSGNQLTRSGLLTMFINTETLELEGSSGANDFTFLDPPTPSIIVHGNASGAALDSVDITGAAGETASYTPNGAITGTGQVLFQSHPISFDTTESVSFLGLTTASLITPNANDSVSTNTGDIFTGNSGGVAFAKLQIGAIGTMTLDTAANDAGAGNDTLVISGGPPGASTFAINAGTGTNTLTLNGTLTVDTDLGAASGTNLATTVSGGTITFAGFQNLKRLEINNGATVHFAGTGVLLNAKELAVTNGVGNLDFAAGQLGSCLSTGSFAVSAGRRFVKRGAGQLTVAAPQTHGAGAVVEVRDVGTLNLNTDCGSASSRTLDVEVTGGILNFGATQHLAVLNTDAGTANLLANGNRVIVTNSLGVGGEAGGINLNDNDLIVDYTGTSQLSNVFGLLTSGHANGGWNGLGIASATAGANPAHNTGLGYAEATDLFTTFPATFSGQQIDSTSVLVKYTYYGDTNFSGNVDLTDFNKMAANFGQSNKQWVQGDSDYNLTVNLIDFNRLASAFGQSGLAPQTVFNSGPKVRSIADLVLEGSA
jgi:hypothetical protein